MKKRRRRAEEIYPIDPRVPPYELWPAQGISGVIGTGSHAGEPVLARKFRIPFREVKSAYMLWLPEEEIGDSSMGDFYLPSDALDSFRVDGSGGLIDYLTTGLDVTWSIDPGDFAVAERYWPASANYVID